MGQDAEDPGGDETDKVASLVELEGGYGEELPSGCGRILWGCQ